MSEEIKPQVLKRTFEALKHPKGSTERAKFNDDALTSEYYTSHKYLSLRPFYMSDGSLHPQTYIKTTHKNKQDASDYLASHIK